MNVYIYIAHHIRGQWHRPISPQTAKAPFLDSYYCHVTCPTHIRPSCLITNHPQKMFQRHISPFHSWTCPLANRPKILWPTHLSRSKLTYSWFLPLLILWESFWNCWRHLQLLTWTIVKRSAPGISLILVSRPKHMPTAVVVGRAKPHQKTIANITANN